MGDVLVFNGQSNTQVTVSFAFNATAEMNEANGLGGLVRIFQSGAATASPGFAVDDFALVSIPWAAVSNESLPSFSATAFYSALQLLSLRPAADADVPLGVIATSWGGTGIKAWASPAVNEACMPL
jgi:sialate O-acetylesterase